MWRRFEGEASGAEGAELTFRMSYPQVYPSESSALEVEPMYAAPPFLARRAPGLPTKELRAITLAISAHAFVALAGCGQILIDTVDGDSGVSGDAMGRDAVVDTDSALDALDAGTLLDGETFDASPPDVSVPNDGNRCGEGTRRTCVIRFVLPAPLTFRSEFDLASLRDNFEVACAPSESADGAITVSIEQAGVLHADVSAEGVALAFLRGNCGGETVECTTETTLEMPVVAGDVITVVVSALDQSFCPAVSVGVSMTL